MGGVVGGVIGGVNGVLGIEDGPQLARTFMLSNDTTLPTNIGRIFELVRCFRIPV